MSDGEVIVSSGKTSESGKDIFQALPPWMPRTESSGNFKLLDVVGRAFDRLGDDISDADDASNIQSAASIGQLKELAELVDLNPKYDEPVDKYRRRVIGEFQQTTNEGDLPSLIKNIEVLLDMNGSEIEYIEAGENGSFILTIPGNAIDSVSLTNIEFNKIISKQVAAGFDISIQSRGTFTYLTPTQYSDDDHTPSKGYDGLNSNGNPKNNGGTYAGFLS